MLTDKAIRALRPSGKPRKVADSLGLYLLIQPNGSRLWRFKYRYDGREKLAAIGAYPEIGLAEARERRDELRRMLSNGIDPAAHRKATRVAQATATENSVEVVAREWFQTMSPGWVDKHRIKDILRAHSGAIVRDDVDGVVEANRQFHLAVAEAAGNGIYLTWVRNLLDHGERIMRLYLRQYDNHVVDTAMEGHRGIVEAIAAQDPAAAEAAGALDAAIMAEGLTKFFLRTGGQEFSVAPSYPAIGGLK
jgi:hypothetical protein